MTVQTPISLSDAKAREACEQARAADLYWRAQRIHELAVILRDSMGTGTRRNMLRAEMTMKRIAVLAGGGEDA